MKELNEAELLSIKRLKHKGVPLPLIAERIGIDVAHVKFVLNGGKEIKPMKRINGTGKLF